MSEFIVSTQLPNLHELQANPNLLLQPDVMRAVIHDPNTLVPTDDPGRSGGFDGPSEKAQDTAQATFDHLATTIIGPEKGAQAAREIKARIGEALHSGVAVYDKNLQSTAATLEGNRVAIHEFAGGSKFFAARQAVDTLYAELTDGQKFQGQDYEVPLAMLQTFARNYADGKQAATQRQETLGQAANDSVQAADTLDESVAQPAHIMHDQVSAERSEGRSFDDTLVDAVITRGQLTITDHQESCADETIRAVGMVEANGEAVHRVYKDTQQLVTYARVFGQVTEEALPHTTTLLDLVGNLNYGISHFKAGEMPSGYVEQHITDIAATLTQIQNGLKQLDNCSSEFQETITVLREIASELAHSPIIS